MWFWPITGTRVHADVPRHHKEWYEGTFGCSPAPENKNTLLRNHPFAFSRLIPVSAQIEGPVKHLHHDTDTARQKIAARQGLSRRCRAIPSRRKSIHCKSTEILSCIETSSPPYRSLSGPLSPSVPGSVRRSVPENRGVRRSVRGSVPRALRAPRSGVSRKCPENVPGVSRTPF